MRKSSVLLLTAFFISTGPLLAQGLKNVLGRKNADSTAPKTSGGLGNLVNKVAGAGGGNLTTTEVVEGLKQALEVGVQRGAGKLSAVDGYFGNALLRILLPPEAQQVERTLRGLGMGQLVDDAILSMNRAAEEAAKEAAPIFVNAIKGITVDDGWAILRGSDSAATQFLKGKTVSPLTQAFRPVIEKSLLATNATRHWNNLFTQYNKVALRKVNPDLPAYVTERALSGLFVQLAYEEKAIRQSPAARSTELLRKVFGQGNL